MKILTKGKAKDAQTWRDLVTCPHCECKMEVFVDDFISITCDFVSITGVLFENLDVFIDVGRLKCADCGKSFQMKDPPIFTEKSLSAEQTRITKEKRDKWENQTNTKEK